MVHQVNSLAEMENLAKDIASELKPGDILLLEGELGAGKTTFTQGLAQLWGVAEPVTSPTYTIVAEYDTDHDWIKKLVHVDLYRLSSEEVASEQAVNEVLDETDEGERVTVIEWADKLSQLPAGARRIRFEHGERENERVVRVGVA